MKTHYPGRIRAALSGVTLVLVLGALLGTGIGPAAAVDDPAASAPETHRAFVLFKGGNAESLNGISYHSFRIPAIVRTNAGTLLAFAEGRAKSNKDYGNINLLYKRGTGNGENASDWSALKEAVGAGSGTWGNPTPVVDRSTGTVWLFLSWNAADKSQSGGTNPDTGEPTTAITKWGERRVYLMKSTDDGQTFTGVDGSASPTDMTASLLPKTLADGSEWAWDAVGPGDGTYTSDGELVIPALHRNLHSPDHGAHWYVQKLGEQTSEGTITQLGDGTLYRDDRPTKASWDTAGRRWVARGGLAGGFSAFGPDNTLLDPRSEASVLQYNNAEPDAPARTVFLNSASTVTRTKMRVRISYDNARTWAVSRPFTEGPVASGAGTEGGYSSMAKTADNKIAALVESNLNTGDDSSSRSILLRKFNLSWILHGCAC